MSALEKTLKKVDQERSRGNFERALERLKEAMAEHPGVMSLVREAVTLSFDLDRAREGVTTLRMAMKRGGADDRAELVAFAREEFQRQARIELGELLFELALGDGSFDVARDVVAKLSEADQQRLLAKLSAKVDAVRESIPDEQKFLVGYLMAQAVVCSALGRFEDTVRALDRALTLNPKLTETIGRLCVQEVQRAPRAVQARLLLARCYLAVKDYGRVAEQMVELAAVPELRPRALELLETSPAEPQLLAAKALLHLHALDAEAAVATLQQLLETSPEAAAVVRRTIERGPHILDKLHALRLLYARVLGATNAPRRAVEELVRANKDGADAATALLVVGELLQKDPRDAELLQLQARLALGSARAQEATTAIARLLEVDRNRATVLRDEVRAEFESSNNPALGRALVELLVTLEEPVEAAHVLEKMRLHADPPRQALYELAGTIAGTYGFTASLAAVYVEAAIDVGRIDDARAAAAHYAQSAKERLAEFMREIESILARRGELAAKLGAVLQGLPVPVDLKLRLVEARLLGDDAEAAVRELAALCTSRPDLQETVLGLLERAVRTRGDVPILLELIAELLADQRRVAAAMEYLARAIRADANATDRVCRRAERVLVPNAARDEVWRPLILALVDVDRPRHTRELCARAQQTVPANRQGFLHAAMGAIHIQGKQTAAAVAAFEAALACDDAPIERIVEGMRRVVAVDRQHGHARFVLGVVLARVGSHETEALQHWAEAVRLDAMLADSIIEQLAEHGAKLASNPEAQLLEGRLLLVRGDRARGVALLDQAFTASAGFAEKTVPLLQVEWDRDPDAATGLALARALRGVGQLRRACRLLSDVARRWPDEQASVLAELETVAATQLLPDVHRTLWEIRLARDEREEAFGHVKQAYEASGPDVDAQREILEAAHRQMPEYGWITCTLAGIEIEAERYARAETLLREHLEIDLGAWKQVLAVVHAHAQKDRRLALLEIDTLLAGERWDPALAALRQFRAASSDSPEPAVERYRLLVEQCTTKLVADLDLALLLQELGRVEEAVSVLEAAVAAADAQAVEVAVETANAIRLALASLYVDLGRDADGKALLATVLENTGTHAQALEFLEQVARKSLVGKLKQLQATITQTPGNTRARLDLARLALTSGELPAARDALTFAGESPTQEATRRYLLARTYADDDQSHLAVAVLRRIQLSDVADDELRRNALYLRGRCEEQLGQFGTAHAVYLQILSEFPGFRDTHVRARSTYQQHLETGLETRALMLEKRTSMESL